MDAYVGVTNDVSLAVKSIIKVKKAFREQMHCLDELIKQNKSLEKRIETVEKTNKNLTNQVKKLEADNKKQHCVVADLLGNTNDFVTSASTAVKPHSNESSPTAGVDGNFVCQELCPLSPSSKKQYKRKSTPVKPTSLRKSRRKLKRTHKTDGTFGGWLIQTLHQKWIYKFTKCYASDRSIQKLCLCGCNVYMTCKTQLQFHIGNYND